MTNKNTQNTVRAMNNIVSLPWPHPCLSPNSTKDRRGKTGIRRRYIQSCWALTLGACINRDLTHLDITFHPPDKRRRDLDNMLASIKYGLDGVAKALGVDDYEWSMSIRRGDPDPAKNGYVIIRFMDAPLVLVEHRGAVT